MQMQCKTWVSENLALAFISSQISHLVMYVYVICRVYPVYLYIHPEAPRDTHGVSGYQYIIFVVLYGGNFAPG